MIDVADLLRRYPRRAAAVRQRPKPRPRPVPRAPDAIPLPLLVAEPVTIASDSLESQLMRIEYQVLLSQHPRSLKARNLCAIIEGYLAFEGCYNRLQKFPWAHVRSRLEALRAAVKDPNTQLTYTPDPCLNPTSAKAA